MISTTMHTEDTTVALPTSPASDWAEVQEGQCRKLFETVLTRTRAKQDVRLLDLGCGAGMLCEMAAARGVRVSGIDTAAPMVDIARQRVAGADLRVGDIEALPFDANAFDSVVAINSLQFTSDPVKALTEALRVSRAGGTLVVATWGIRGDCESAAVIASIAALANPESETTGPFALSRAGALETIATEAGWKPLRIEHVVCEWQYPDMETAFRGLLSTGVARRAAGAVGTERVRSVVADQLDAFRRVDGSYRMHNAFRYLTAEK